MSGVSFIRSHACVFLCLCCYLNPLCLFVGKFCLKLKRQYHTRLENVREYLETVKNFDELISPQSLSFHFLGSEPSSKVRKDIETI